LAVRFFAVRLWKNARQGTSFPCARKNTHGKYGVSRSDVATNRVHGTQWTQRMDTQTPDECTHVVQSLFLLEKQFHSPNLRSHFCSQDFAKY
jgi:hypothetical protein